MKRTTTATATATIAAERDTFLRAYLKPAKPPRTAGNRARLTFNLETKQISGTLARALKMWFKEPQIHTASDHAKRYGVSVAQFRKALYAFDTAWVAYTTPKIFKPVRNQLEALRDAYLAENENKTLRPFKPVLSELEVLRDAHFAKIKADARNAYLKVKNGR